MPNVCDACGCMTEGGRAAAGLGQMEAAEIQKVTANQGAGAAACSARRPSPPPRRTSALRPRSSRSHLRELGPGLGWRHGCPPWRGGGCPHRGDLAPLLILISNRRKEESCLEGLEQLCVPGECPKPSAPLLRSRSPWDTSRVGQLAGVALRRSPEPPLSREPGAGMP